MKEKKRGNDLVDLRVFRERLEKVTNYVTQSSIEEKAGIKPGGLSRLYSGVDALTVDHLVKLASAYGCSIDYLLGRDVLPAGNNGSTVNALSVVDFLDNLLKLDYIKIDSHEWEDYSSEYMSTEKISSAAVLIRNGSLNRLIKNYAELKKALAVVPADLEKEMYSLWKDSLKDYKFKKGTLADWQYENDRNNAIYGV